MPVVPRLGRVLRILPLAFVLLALTNVGLGIAVLAQLPSGPPQAPRPSGAADAATTTSAAPAGANDGGVQDLQHKVDELKWVLTVLLGAAGLFTIAQGAAAFFTAQTFVKQAEDAVKRVQDVASDAERRYPVFSKAEEARRDAYRALAATFYGDGLDWRDSLYDQMAVVDRQRLLSVERFVGLEFIAIAENDAEYAANLRRLANFYASKYVSEGRTYRGDRERAEYYLQLARKATNDQFWILNDLGLLCLELYDPRNTGEARNLFEKSYAQNPRQQRALYNLAVMATYENPPRWAEAARWLETALQERLWERAETPEMTCNVYYNLACARARLGQFDECLASLENAARIGRVRTRTVERDANLPDGDLYELAQHADAGKRRRFEGLRDELSRNVGVRRTPAIGGPVGVRQRIQRAWDVLRGRG